MASKECFTYSKEETPFPTTSRSILHASSEYTVSLNRICEHHMQQVRVRHSSFLPIAPPRPPYHLVTMIAFLIITSVCYCKHSLYEQRPGYAYAKCIFRFIQSNIAIFHFFAMKCMSYISRLMFVHILYLQSKSKTKTAIAHQSPLSIH